MPFTHWRAATHPKVLGTWNLHNHFSNSLNFFIMLSSMTAVLGNTSQANYAAAGGFQDAFARYRTTRGLPAVSLDLGMVKSVGFVAETEGVRERLEKIGYRPLEEEEVLRLVEAAIRNPLRPLHASQITTGIAPFDTADGIAWRLDRRFSGLTTRQHQQPSFSGQNDKPTGGGKDISIKDLLSSPSPPSHPEALSLVSSTITAKLSDMFMLPKSDIDKSQPLAKYGVDSLVAVELRNWLVARARVDLSIFEILQSASLEALAGVVVERCGVRRV